MATRFCDADIAEELDYRFRPFEPWRGNPCFENLLVDVAPVADAAQFARQFGNLTGEHGVDVVVAEGRRVLREERVRLDDPGCDCDRGDKHHGRVASGTSLPTMPIRLVANQVFG